MHQNHYTNQPDAPKMWLTVADEEPACPVEIEELKGKFSWLALLRMPMHCVESLIWGEAAKDKRFIQEAPIVVDQVKDARTLKAI